MAVGSISSVFCIASEALARKECIIVEAGHMLVEDL